MCCWMFNGGIILCFFYSGTFRFQHQQECEARQTAEALVVHVRERIEVLEKKMAL